MSARKELIAFMLVAAAALGSILTFALTSHRREAQTRPGTLVQAATVDGECPAEIKLRRATEGPLQLCAARCTRQAQTPGTCDCEILVERCRDIAAPTP
jgi:hypothetical protein